MAPTDPPTDPPTDASDADRVIDVDDKKIEPREALLWKVCVLCEAYMRECEA